MDHERVHHGDTETQSVPEKCNVLDSKDGAKDYGDLNLSGELRIKRFSTWVVTKASYNPLLAALENKTAWGPGCAPAFGPGVRRCLALRFVALPARAIEVATMNLKKDTLRLSAEYRTALAQRLLLSLNDLPAAEHAELSLAEVARRARQPDRGEVEPIPAYEVRRSDRASFGVNGKLLFTQ
jgi:hypothetical protein